jgi:hypothetical protein
MFQRTSKKHRVPRRLGIELLEDRRVLSVATLSATAQPTNFDQYLLELVNRGRANPTAEANRYGINLNQGLAAGTISTAPKQPLAFSPALIASSRGHSQWMIDTNTFSHIGQGGSFPGQRMVAAGYSFVAPWAGQKTFIGEAPPARSRRSSYVNEIHKDSVPEPVAPSEPDERHLPRVRHGVVSGKFLHQGTNFNALMVTEDFAFSGNSVFLTGVVYDDNLVSANGFYTPGEGLGGVTVTATRNSDGQSFSTQTWASGGYTLPLNNGTYTVTASGGALGVTLVKNNVSVETQNVKVDFTRADNAAPVVSSLTATPSPVARPGILTLTAGGVSDPRWPSGKGPILSRFQRERGLGSERRGAGHGPECQRGMDLERQYGWLGSGAAQVLRPCAGQPKRVEPAGHSGGERDQRSADHRQPGRQPQLACPIRRPHADRQRGAGSGRNRGARRVLSGQHVVGQRFTEQ